MEHTKWQNSFTATQDCLQLENFNTCFAHKIICTFIGTLKLLCWYCQNTICPRVDFLFPSRSGFWEWIFFIPFSFPTLRFFSPFLFWSCELTSGNQKRELEYRQIFSIWISSAALPDFKPRGPCCTTWVKCLFLFNQPTTDHLGEF